MSDDEPSRLETELELLQAMYPSQTHYNSQSRELKFSADDSHATLSLRLPEPYPESGFPDIISATDASRNDLRGRTKTAVKELGLAEGEEALDAIIATFQALLESDIPQNDPSAKTTGTKNASMAKQEGIEDSCKTILIWLHHLLNTSKRKLALSPPPSTPLVSGLTKPGYPGILVYSGPAAAVTEHVDTLKAQNWQAFQVRYEEKGVWLFAHGEGVREVESMSEVVKGVEVGNVGARQKQELLKAVGIK